MSTKTADYGAATVKPIENGVTLRDHFAAKAMQATLSDPAYVTWSKDRHAQQAYLMADAMIKAREDAE